MTRTGTGSNISSGTISGPELSPKTFSAAGIRKLDRWHSPGSSGAWSVVSGEAGSSVGRYIIV